MSNLYPWGYVPCPAYPPSFDDIYTRRTLRCFAGSHLRCRVVALPALVDAAYTPCPTFRDHPYDLCCILDKPSLISDDSVALSEPGHSSSGKPKRKISAAICTDNGPSQRRVTHMSWTHARQPKSCQPSQAPRACAASLPMSS